MALSKAATYGVVHSSDLCSNKVLNIEFWILHIYRGTGLNIIILGIHVDDQAIMGPSIDVIRKFEGELASKFKMKDLGALTHILGVEVKRDQQRRILTLHQSSYVQQVLERYGMSDCNPTKLPFSPHLTFSLDDEPTLKPDLEAITDYRAKVGSLIYDMKQYLLPTRHISQAYV